MKRSVMELAFAALLTAILFVQQVALSVLPNVHLCAALLLRKKERPASVWAALAGAFGLSFGFLCAIPYFFIGGPAGGISYWISGIPFDLVHCASNTLLTLVLWKPLRTLAGKLNVRLNGGGSV